MHWLIPGKTEGIIWISYFHFFCRGPGYLDRSTYQGYIQYTMQETLESFNKISKDLFSNLILLLANFCDEDHFLQQLVHNYLNCFAFIV